MIGRRRGFTMLEVVFATFLLLFMLLTIMSMFTLANRPAGSNRNIYLSSALAERKLEEARAWAYAKTAGKDNFLDFGAAGVDPYLSASGTDTTHPQLAWEMSGEWETQYTNVGELSRSIRKVRVRVRWTEGSETKDLVAVAMIGEPRRAIDTIQLSPPGPVTVQVGATKGFTATARDSDDRVIPDVTFRWTVLAESASGQLLVSGEPVAVGPAITFQANELPDGVVTGQCYLVVSGSCGGEQKEATATIQVTP